MPLGVSGLSGEYRVYNGSGGKYQQIYTSRAIFADLEIAKRVIPSYKKCCVTETCFAGFLVPQLPLLSLLIV